MDSLANGFQRIEYLSTFHAFVYGYAIAKYFNGWARLINYRKSVNISIEQINWKTSAFCILIFVWWDSWGRLPSFEKNQLEFYASMLIPFLLCILANLHFPTLNSRNFINYGRIFLFHRKKNHFLFIIILSALIISRINRELYDIPLILFCIAAVLSLFAFLVKKRKLEKLVPYLIITLVAILYFFVPRYPRSQYSLEGYSMSEYIFIYISFIFGFIASKFFDGWSYFVLNRKSLWEHRVFLLWTLLLFGLLLDFWWGLWQRNGIINKDFGNFIVSLFVPLGFFLLSSILFPYHKDEKLTYVLHDKKMKVIYSYIIFIFVWDLISSKVVHGWYFPMQDDYFRIAAIALSVIGIVASSKALHLTILGLGWAAFAAHSIIPHFMD